MAKRVVVSIDAVKRAGLRSTRASAKLAGREVPDGHERSLAVQQFIDERGAEAIGDLRDLSERSLDGEDVDWPPGGV